MSEKELKNGIQAIIDTYNLASASSEKAALVDIIIDQLHVEDKANWTEAHIRKTIEQEIIVWENMRGSHNQRYWS